MEESQAEAETPKFFDLLTDNDRVLYNNMRSGLSSHACRNRRGKRLETFGEMLKAIKTFCIRNDEDDWKRCLVCGVCWLSNGIAINTRHLSLLIDKCKSSINGSLQKLGYTTLQSRQESNDQLSEFIPILKNNFNELREWTIRQQVPHEGQQQQQVSSPSSQSSQSQNQLQFAMTPVPKVQMPMINQMYPVPQAMSVPNIAGSEQVMSYAMQQQPPLTPLPQFPQFPMYNENVINQQQQQIMKYNEQLQQQQQQQQQYMQYQQMPQQISETRDDNQFMDDDYQDMQSPAIDNNYDEFDPLALTPNFFYDGDEYDQPYDQV